tara:strand:+ start:55 stop:345 length:291 start_codon:yes stop_codon:yes gene_type:complete
MFKINKLTLLHIAIVILALILFSCNTPPLPVVKAKNFFTLTDYKDVIHTYNKPVIIKHLKTDTMYCKVHHRWEIIRAVWIMDNNDFDYFVGKHHKS